MGMMGAEQYARSNYVMNFGSENLDNTMSMAMVNTNGPFRMNSASSFASVRDGLTNTVMFSEIIAERDPMKPDGAWAFGDAGSSAYTHANLPNCGGGAPAGCITTSAGAWGAEMWDSAIATASSNHPDGVNIALCMTNATFQSHSVDLQIWEAKGTAAGGELVFQE